MDILPVAGQTAGLNVLQDVLDERNRLLDRVHNYDFSVSDLESMDQKELAVVNIIRLQEVKHILKALLTLEKEKVSESQDKWKPFDLSQSDNYTLILQYKSSQLASILNTVGSSSVVSISLPGAGASFTKTLTQGSWFKLPYPPGTRIYQVTGNTFCAGLLHYGDQFLGSDL